MKMRQFVKLAVFAHAAGLCLASATSANPIWNRLNDWSPGTQQGGNSGNPGPGGGGAAVWQYEWTAGGPLGSANPWYAQPTNLMTWDSAWWQTGWGVWSKGNDVNPPIKDDRLIHNLHTSTFGDIPVVRWLNPAGQGAQIDIAGLMTLNWTGAGGYSYVTPVDVAIAHFSAASNTTSLLFGNTYAKPMPFPSSGDSVLIPVSLTSITLGAGDSILISLRGHESFGPLGSWVNLHDNLNITLVPAPGVLALAGIAGLVALRRRRQPQR